MNRFNGAKAYVVSVNMGYGHQRTAYPLRYLSFEKKIINANDYPEISEKDRKIWKSTQGFYEFVSNFKRTPILGDFAFSIFDAFQKILSFYPKRDLSRPSFTLRQIYSTFQKAGWGKDLIERLIAKNTGGDPLPFITTFFTPAFMAEFFGYPGEIFCVICDADISRTWAPLRPAESKIKYFAPTQRVAERLQLYGVTKENIFFTGYPLPLENIGQENLETAREDLKKRLLNLDPKRKYFEKYRILIEKHLGKLPEKENRPLTLMFSVGGAGAQKEIGVKIVKNLKEKIKSNEIKIILTAGIRKKVKEYFEKCLKNLELEKYLNQNIEIIYQENIEDYFSIFNEKLREIDILWTKPSELSFYSALGVPIIIAPTIGSQEDFNKRWLLKSGFGLSQENPDYTQQWLYDWLENGYLAEAAMQGFIEGEKRGTIKIKEIVEK